MRTVRDRQFGELPFRELRVSVKRGPDGCGWRMRMADGKTRMEKCGWKNADEKKNNN